MRKLTSFDQEELALKFGRILKAYEIDHAALPAADPPACELWIVDEDRMGAAQDLLTRFQVDPSGLAAQAGTANSLAASAKSARGEIAEKWRSVSKRRRTAVVASGNRATVTLIAICVAIYFLIATGLGGGLVSYMYYSRYTYPLFVEIREGQIWRVITPLFLHMGILHIAFNMLWLYQLGSQVETNQGPRFLLLAIFIIGALSNTVEYLVPPHNPFGGMSGVIYGLLGYIWAMGRYYPRSGYFMDNGSLWFMIVWLFLCMTGVFGPTANWAHLTGLVCGLSLGYLMARRNA